MEQRKPLYNVCCKFYACLNINKIFTDFMHVSALKLLDDTNKVFTDDQFIAMSAHLYKFLAQYL